MSVVIGTSSCGESSAVLAKVACLLNAWEVSGMALKPDSSQTDNV